jgi:hypothetical protein
MRGLSRDAKCARDLTGVDPWLGVERLEDEGEGRG